MKTYLIIIPFLLLAISCNDEKKEEETVEPITKEVDKVMGIAMIEPQKGIINLTATNSGTIDQLLISENDEVEKGQVIITLDRTTERLKLNQSTSKLSTQRSTIEANKIDAEAKKESYLNAQNTYNTNVKLFAIKSITKQTLDDSKTDMDTKEKEYLKANQNIALAQNKLNELQADIKYDQQNLADMQIVAPYSGKILTVDVYVGDNITTSTVIGEFAPAGHLIATTEVDELFAYDLKIGQKAEIKSQSTAESLGNGEVYFLSDYLKKRSLFEDENNVEDRRVRTVKIKLDSTSNPLINSRVDCIIYLK